jgi:hypothetical protein
MKCFFGDCDNEVDENDFEFQDGKFTCNSCMERLGDE